MPLPGGRGEGQVLEPCQAAKQAVDALEGLSLHRSPPGPNPDLMTSKATSLHKD